MRILHIDKFISSDRAFTGGVGECIELMNRLLVGRGHEVLHFGCDGTTGPAFEDFTALKSPRTFCRMIHNTQAAEKLRLFLREHPVDVVHLHNVYRHLTPSIIPVAKSCGIVMTVHDYRQAGMERYFWSLPSENSRYAEAAAVRCTGAGGIALQLEELFQRFTRRYFSGIDYFLCPTKHMLQSMQKQGAPAGKLACFPNPVHFPKPGKSDGRVVYAGRLAAEKSPEILLALAEALPETTISVAGDGPEREYLASRAPANVEFKGQLSRAMMDELYGSASVVVITSCCRENSPAAMLEAMAAGVCVVAPDQPSLREWIRDGRTGRLYATGDTTDLIRVVTEVLAAKSLSAEFGRNARELVLKRHDPNRIAEGLEYFYHLAAQKAKMRRILQ